MEFLYDKSRGRPIQTFAILNRNTCRPNPRTVKHGEVNLDKRFKTDDSGLSSPEADEEASS